MSFCCKPSGKAIWRLFHVSWNAIAVRAALDALPPNQRLAIVLRYYENLGYKEIASALETTTKAVERLLARGRERLRNVLGRRGSFIDF